ncbi:aspartate/glutamate racemase family protein [Piscibacillus salipiscarius]|uniref:Aspartate/glutamate racemase family protein n=1 Tax=Piscibacillus salipiscarius TaxID=299480 RepID=A0ABW5QAZ3_9BACI|nr:aspartate/glutamate racemase family protein [Piscibacillus salipiscarius]
MLYRANPGQVSYGESIGILLMDTYTPFVPGDVGNATTYSFPVRFQRVQGLTFDQLLTKDQALVEPLLEAGHELVKEGVRAITGDCGYMAMFQKEIAKELKVPVFLSSLLQLPFMSAMLGPNEKIGIICSHSTYFDHDLISGMGLYVDPGKISVIGMETQEHFRLAAHVENGLLDPEVVEQEALSVAIDLVTREPEVKMILLECSSLPPYGKAIQQATGLPVFDYITMIEYVHSALVKKRYKGFM